VTTDTKTMPPHRMQAGTPRSGVDRENPSAPLKETDTAPHGPLIVFAGGGSGGHLYPALAVAEQMRARRPETQFAFFGTRRPVDLRILENLDCKFVAQDLPGFSIKPWRWSAFLMGLNRSVRQCRSFFTECRPNIVLGTGGMAALPALLAAKRLDIPTALLNPDSIPGKANRYFASNAGAIFAQWEDTIELLPPRARPRVEVTGCPVRAEFNQADRRSGIERFRLDLDRKTLLVTGASQGARSVNQAVVAILDFLETLPDWQVLHLTGEQDYATVRDAYGGRSVRAVVIDYTDQMADALAAADFVVSRAGASTLAEITAVGRASVLMPYPYHRDGHQTANARCLVRASAARLLPDLIDPALNGPALRETIEPLMRDDDAREALAAAARRIGRGNAASLIAQRLMELADQSASTARCETV
jgi:UDP-N-acetylglucosamine--N-acetylmuramyl-(pentapeptide) pyrophosphoryl-undecaprenol N-acetylglucosamine transferase